VHSEHTEARVPKQESVKFQERERLGYRKRVRGLWGKSGSGEAVP
jgi:hypothetical protein